ncbi:MAG TPA: hypothetical protein VIY86_09625, partial [Pirellulaceae bacterium]
MPHYLDLYFRQEQIMGPIGSRGDSCPTIQESSATSIFFQSPILGRLSKSWLKGLVHLAWLPAAEAPAGIASRCFTPSRRRRRSSPIRPTATSRIHPLCFQSLESRRVFCSLHQSLLPPAPEFDWAIESAEANRLAGLGPGDGGPEAVGIVWTNRGLSSDNFTATFGTTAPAARTVVDAALDHWERVITNWNRSDGTVTLQVSISMATTGSGFGGAAAPGATAPSDGKPRTGSITLGRGQITPDPNDANGWYLDANPNDHAEFGTSITSAFAGRGTGLGFDFYSLLTIEFTHVLGLVSDKNNDGGAYQGYRLESSGMVTNTNVVDNAEGNGDFGTFWAFEGPTVDHLMTSYNSGDGTAASWGNVVHSAGVRPTNLLFNGQNWQGSEDVGNAIYTNDERLLPSWTMAHILADAYDYSIVDPEQFDTFYANLNRSTGALMVRGGNFHNTGTPTSDDVITVSVDGSELVVSVNVSNDIPGTRHLSGPGNLPAWTTRFPLSTVDSIEVDALEGNDAIYIYGLPANTPLNILAGSGGDLIDLGGGDFDTRL